MRILHFYWVDPEDRAARGGGVRGYAQSLMAEQRATNGHHCIALSAGLAHDISPTAPPKWRAVGPDRYEFVNTRPIAPSHADFASPAQLSDPATEALFRAFLHRTGPYDVIHFHGLEGLPARVLEMRRELPETRFVLSLHNYYPFCPQVNLWWQERAHCADFERGRRCATCLPLEPNPMAIRRAYAVEGAFAKLGAPPGSWGYDRLLRPALVGGWRMLKALRGRNAPAPTTPTADTDTHAAAGRHFAQRRAEMVRLINAHCDTVLAVSDRVRDIAKGFGIGKAQTCYIGTRHASEWARTKPRDVRPDPLRLVYLGYMRADKGFGFLLDALHDMPADVLARLHLTVAARKGPQQMMTRLQALTPRLAGLQRHDGYTAAEMDGILAQADIGIVPPLWEDNLPQVALEMHARHIPLITSDRGGAQELPGTRQLVFRAGDAAGFARVLDLVLSGSVDWTAYWSGARAPTDLSAHAEQLDSFYAGAT